MASNSAASSQSRYSGSTREPSAGDLLVPVVADLLDDRPGTVPLTVLTAGLLCSGRREHSGPSLDHRQEGRDGPESVDRAG